MRDYGKVSPQFWLGKTGRALRGDMEAQVIALYLMTSPHANMIGVFYCPISYMAKETGIPIEGASKGLRRLIDGGFCTYDEDNEYVFVHEFAAHQVGDALKAEDKRVQGIKNELSKVPESECRRAFQAKYAEAFHLDPPSKKTKPLRSPSQAPSKPETETGAETEVARASRKTTLPVGFAISDRVRDWAEKNGHRRIEEQFDAFVSYARRKGATYADWDEALMTAIRADWAKTATKAAVTDIFAGAR